MRIITKPQITIICLMLGGALLLANGCGTPKKKLVLFVASSLVQPVDEFSRAFRDRFPEIEIIREAGGSQLHCRKITDLNKPCDVLLIAEPRFFESILGPEIVDWHIDFAENEIVILYTDRSRLNNRITADNWLEILLRPEVVVGRVDENVGPVGFRTLHMWKLAEKHYSFPGLYDKLLAKCPSKNTRPDATAVLPPLENGTFDYAFDYKSVAKQHRLQFVQLPPEINLGAPAERDSYARVAISIRGSGGRLLPLEGVPIIFGLSIPKNAPHPEEALLFVRELLSPGGKKILEDNYQPILDEFQITGPENIPSSLKKSLAIR